MWIWRMTPFWHSLGTESLNTSQRHADKIRKQILTNLFLPWVKYTSTSYSKLYALNRMRVSLNVTTICHYRYSIEDWETPASICFLEFVICMADLDKYQNFWNSDVRYRSHCSYNSYYSGLFKSLSAELSYNIKRSLMQNFQLMTPCL